ncbi:hypothetical protein Mgra_00007474 [Meloidogyne graminicola]|uniref:Uncharacterized protein n=1 Tax=Meloidogyne graminicola TaxID=189291 RepID=A0A8S9ZIA4_9BILA|nr:hypothetical protein Mgra_00007474 [Meloidogyne graminicola]
MYFYLKFSFNNTTFNYLLFFIFVFYHLNSYNTTNSAKFSCIKNCSEIFKHSLSSISGIGYKTPLDMLSPLYLIIKYSANNVVVLRKTEWICLSVEKFKICLDNCIDNRQKMVELANHFLNLLLVQRKHLEEVNRKCKPLPLKDELKISLWEFCRKINDYTKCYAGIKLKCSKNATQIYNKIIESINKAFERIKHISKGHLIIPDECKKRIDESRHILIDEQSEEEIEKKQILLEEEDYWTDLINKKNITIKNNGNILKIINYNLFLLLFILFFNF